MIRQRGAPLPRHLSLAVLVAACGSGSDGKPPTASSPAPAPAPAPNVPASSAPTPASAAPPGPAIAVAEPTAPSGWVPAVGLGWACSFPAPVTLQKLPSPPPYRQNQGAFLEIAGGSRVVVISATWDPALQTDGFSPAYFSSAKREMGITVGASRMSTFERDGLRCESEDVTGTIAAVPVDLKILLCSGRGMVIAWSGTPSHLSEVVASCHLTPIADP
jgi:hypothetical protein